MAGVIGNIDSYYNTICWNSLLLLINTQSVSEFFKGKYSPSFTPVGLVRYVNIIYLHTNEYIQFLNTNIYSYLCVAPTPSFVKICYPSAKSPFWASLNSVIEGIKQDQSAGNRNNNDFFLSVPRSIAARDPLDYSLLKEGSSETTRVTSYSAFGHDNIQFGYWLAGLIDGDGSLLVSKLGHPYIEITLHEEDVKTLYKIKDLTGVGCVTKRTNTKAYRIRFLNRHACITVINLINGKLLTSTKHLQLINICKVLNINPITNNTFSKDNAWFSGFFDAEGYITVRNKYTLTLSVAQKDRTILEQIQLGFNCGNIHYDKSWDGYNFNTTKRDYNLILLDYFYKFPLLTIKNVDLITFRRLLLFISRKYHHKDSPYKDRIDHLITLFKNRKKI